MSKEKSKEVKKDLRGGLHGSLTVPTVPLAGATQVNPDQELALATPDVTVPTGQVTHE